MGAILAARRPFFCQPPLSQQLRAALHQKYHSAKYDNNESQQPDAKPYVILVICLGDGRGLTALQD
jgi:hypothetical protein